MKAAGIVRRMDDLGRMVIPWEACRTFRIPEKDPLLTRTDTEGAILYRDAGFPEAD